METLLGNVDQWSIPSQLRRVKLRQNTTPKPVRILPNGLKDLFLQEKNCNRGMKKMRRDAGPARVAAPGFWVHTP